MELNLKIDEKTIQAITDIAASLQQSMSKVQIPDFPKISTSPLTHEYDDRDVFSDHVGKKTDAANNVHVTESEVFDKFVEMKNKIASIKGVKGEVLSGIIDLCQDSPEIFTLIRNGGITIRALQDRLPLASTSAVARVVKEIREGSFDYIFN
jgi:hypothetical protein